jgi:hypothetical protein
MLRYSYFLKATGHTKYRKEYIRCLDPVPRPCAMRRTLYGSGLKVKAWQDIIVGTYLATYLFTYLPREGRGTLLGHAEQAKGPPLSSHCRSCI